MSEQPPLPGVSADTPESPTPLADEGMTWFFMPDGTRTQGRASWDANPWVWVVSFKRDGGAS